MIGSMWNWLDSNQLQSEDLRRALGPERAKGVACLKTDLGRRDQELLIKSTCRSRVCLCIDLWISEVNHIVDGLKIQKLVLKCVVKNCCHIERNFVRLVYDMEEECLGSLHCRELSKVDWQSCEHSWQLFSDILLKEEQPWLNVDYRLLHWWR